MGNLSMVVLYSWRCISSTTCTSQLHATRDTLVTSRGWSSARVTHSPRHRPTREFRLVINMVEGHGVHRVAAQIRNKLLRKRFVATSPNDRFAEGAQAINNLPLTGYASRTLEHAIHSLRVLTYLVVRAEAIGKNLFTFFGEGKDTVVVHTHFGMSGRYSIRQLPGDEVVRRLCTRRVPIRLLRGITNSSTTFDLQAKPTTRLQLISKEHNLICQVSAQALNFGDISLYKEKQNALGPDPIREDCDKVTSTLLSIMLPL